MVGLAARLPLRLRMPSLTGRTAVALPRLSPRLQLVRSALVLVSVVSLSLVLELLVVSSLQQRASQQRAFDRFRNALAQGTAPVGPTDGNGHELRPGTPVAYLEIPSIGVRQVVGEGTSGGNLFGGPGHRRDTPLPGQVGVSIVLGRQASFGGPFARIDELRSGETIRVTTGQGRFAYKVTGQRRAGDPAPGAARPGSGRLLLLTAGGRPFMPSGVLRVDAEMTVPAVPAPPRLVGSSGLRPSEQIMGADTGTLWALALWLQALTLTMLGAVCAWHRWGRAKAWVVFLPPLLLIGLSTAGEAARMLPNLL